MRSWRILVILALCCTALPAYADAAATAPAGREEPSPYPKFEEVTKDMEAQKGLFTLWAYPTSAKDKDKEKLLCQIPAAFLGQKFMISTSFSGGGFFTGFPLDEQVVSLELLDRQLVVVEPQTQYVTDTKGTVADVVKRTHPDRIRAATPILTKSPGGDPVIDLSALLKGSLVDVSFFGGGFRSGGGPRGGVNPALSKWTEKKVFELNVEIGVELAMGRPYPPGSFDKILIHYSFWKLPQTDYKPRIADDRVGYFLTANQDWSKPADSRELFNRYIDRWNLVKRDPALAKCEPREPIIFYIEKTVPVRYRKAIRDGILEWNKAFEKVGFVDAVQVRQQTEDNEWKDLDPEDMRYSFFRWIVTGGGFAMGPHRANPFTGQIYDADIVFDDSVVRYCESDARETLPLSLTELKMSDPAVRKLAEANPDYIQIPSDWHKFLVGRDTEPARPTPPRGRGLEDGDYAREMAHQLIVARALLPDVPREVLDRMVYEMVRHIATHEVGHTLGLRHNFKASSIYTLEELKRRRFTGEALSGSVMDYNPMLYFEERPTEGSFVTPTLGPWDDWAIEYGYRPADGNYQPPARAKATTAPAGTEPERGGETKPAVAEKRPELPADVLAKLPPEVKKMLESGGKSEAAKPAPGSEEAMLAAIASRAAEPQLAYATDEDTTMVSPDPRSNRHDAADDPVAYAKDRIGVINKRLAGILKWSVKDGESWYFMQQSFLHLTFEKARLLDYVGRYIGGQYSSRSHRGDPDEQAPFQVVDASTQRRAMAFIESTLFDDNFLAVSPALLVHLTDPRWYHDGMYISAMPDFPIHEYIAMLQWWNLFDRFLPPTLQRIQDAEMKADSQDKFTVAEYLQRLQRSIWAVSLDAERKARGEWSDAGPFVPDTRRSLQRTYLQCVEPLVRNRPGRMLSPDLHAMLQQSLRDVSRQIETVLKQPGATLDFASAAHLSACKSRIDRLLTPPLEESGSSMSRQMFE